MKGEILYAVTHEGALHLDGVLARRTHVAIETPDHGMVAASHVGDIMAPLLGWGPEQLHDDLAAYAASVGHRDGHVP